VGRLLQIACGLGVSVASHSTDVGRLIRSHVNLIGIDILCEKQRDLAISDQAVEFSVFGIHLLLWLALYCGDRRALLTAVAARFPRPAP
jgi:hypothetical protein